MVVDFGCVLLSSRDGEFVVGGEIDCGQNEIVVSGQQCSGMGDDVTRPDVWSPRRIISVRGVMSMKHPYAEEEVWKKLQECLEHQCRRCS